MKNEQPTYTITHDDKNKIRHIVDSFDPGDRVKTLRTIFKTNCSYEHFMFLGECIAEAKNRKTNAVLWNERNRMQVLASMN